jgi:valyl-tRNA synthetase
MAKPDLSSQPDADPDRRAGAQAVLWTVLSETLVLLHPIIPFVTQEIWSHLPWIEDRNLARAPYPARRPQCLSDTVGRHMELLQGVVVSVRNIRSELGIGPSVRLDALVRTASDEDRAFLDENAELIRVLARLSSLAGGPDVAAPRASASAVVAGGNEVYVVLTGAIDFDAEIARLDKEQGKLAKDLDIIRRKLGNEDFVAKAPAAVVDKEKAKAADLSDKHAKLAALKDRLAAVKG